MIKKVLVLMAVCVLLMPAQAMANDGGGPILDDKNLLAIEYKLYSNEVEIGGKFKFSLSLKNNTNYPVSMMDITRIFSNTSIEEDVSFFKWLDPDSIIYSGEKITFEISTNVPENIFWYKIGDEYYCDFDLGLMYDTCVLDYGEHGDLTQEEFEDNYGYWEYINSQLKKVPLNITNLFDGSDIVELDLVENETTFYFPEFQDYESNIYKNYLKSEINNELSITNISNVLVEVIYISNLKYNRSNQILLPFIESKEVATANIEHSYFIPPSNISETLPAVCQINFKSENKYYGIEIIKEYPAELLECPKLKLKTSLNSHNNNSVQYTIEVTNTSKLDYENLYIDFSHNKYNSGNEADDYSPNQIILLLESNESIEVPNFISPTNLDNYFIGIIEDGKLFYWNVDSESNPIYYREGYYDLYYYLSELDPTPTPTPSSTPLPTAKPIYYDSPVSTFQNPTPTASPSIEITDIKKTSSIPFWVWIVLCVAVIGSGVIVFFLRKKAGSKDKKIDDLPHGD